MKLAIVITHPIQYYAPLFRLLHKRNKIAIKVFYTWEKGASSFDVDFGRTVDWGIPLLDGYDFQFVSNEGSPRRDFMGVRNPGLIREIESWGAHALLVFGWNYYSHLKAMRYFKNKIPVLFRGDSTLIDETAGLKRTARRIFLRWIYRHVDIGLSVGTNNKNYFLAHGMRNDQLVFAPHAIDNDRFHDKDGQYREKALKERRELGIKDDETAFVFVGKFQEKKNPLLLVRAFNQLRHPGARLLMVGDGKLGQLLKEAGRENEKIHFLPFQDQSRMPVIYRMGDIFCLPSQGPGETWGLAVNEAMACGRPVLVSDRCGCAVDLVSNGKNGFIFASGDKDDLLDKLNTFVERSQAIPAMGEGSEAMIKNWSYDQVTAVIEEVMTGYA